MIVRVSDLRFVCCVAHIFEDGPIAHGIECRDEGIQRAASRVSTCPDWLAICGCEIARVILFLTLVNDGDAISEHSICNCVLCQNLIGCERWETWVVMILNERAEECSVGASPLHPVDTIGQFRHRARGRLECSLDPEIRWVVHRTWHVLLIRANDIWISMEGFADGIHASSVNKIIEEA